MDWKSRPSRGASGVEGGSGVTDAGDEVEASWGAGEELFSGNSLPSLGGSAGAGTPYLLGGGWGGGAYFGGGGPYAGGGAPYLGGGAPYLGGGGPYLGVPANRMESFTKSS